MRFASVVVSICLGCATAVWAQSRPAAAPQTPPAATGSADGAKADGDAEKPAENEKERGGFWSWLGGNKGDSVERPDVPDRVERPLRIERPERAGGGCCQ